VDKIKTIMPVKVMFELKRVEDLESVLNEVENIRNTHPDTAINVEIRVQLED